MGLESCRVRVPVSWPGFSRAEFALPKAAVGRFIGKSGANIQAGPAAGSRVGRALIRTLSERDRKIKQSRPFLSEGWNCQNYFAGFLGATSPKGASVRSKGIATEGTFPALLQETAPCEIKIRRRNSGHSSILKPTLPTKSTTGKEQFSILGLQGAHEGSQVTEVSMLRARRQSLSCTGKSKVPNDAVSRVRDGSEVVAQIDQLSMTSFSEELAAGPGHAKGAWRENCGGRGGGAAPWLGFLLCNVNLILAEPQTPGFKRVHVLGQNEATSMLLSCIG